MRYRRSDQSMGSNVISGFIALFFQRIIGRQSATDGLVHCIYVPITQDGKVVDSQGYMLDLQDE